MFLQSLYVLKMSSASHDPLAMRPANVRGVEEPNQAIRSNNVTEIDDHRIIVAIILRLYLLKLSACHLESGEAC